MFFRFPPDARWNSERSVVEFGIGVGEYEGVVRVSRRVFQIVLTEAPTPERCLEAYHLHRTRLELIAERKVRRRQLTDDGTSRSPVAICGNGKSGSVIHAVLVIAGPIHEDGGSTCSGCHAEVTGIYWPVTCRHEQTA